MSGTSTPPGELGPSGRELHRQILDDLPPNWELDAKDHHNLEAACRAHDRARALERIIDCDGLLVDGKPHPLLVEARLQAQLAAHLLGKVETEPKVSTRHLNSRQRAELKRLGAVS